MNEQDITVNEALAAIGIVFTARYAGERVQWGTQQVDAWRVTFARPAANGKPAAPFETDFYQGLGHRKPIKGAPPKTRAEWSGTFGRRQWDIRFLKPSTPTAAAVLYCLLSDARATEQCFADWAVDLGYDTDSRKALAIYEACCATGLELRRVFTPDQRAELSALLQNY